MTLWFYTGTPGSGKSYHILEDVIKHLQNGGYVIANFPLKFTEGMTKKGYYERFMFVPDEVLMGARGVSLLIQTSMDKKWYSDDSVKEGHCMVVLDEAGNYFPPETSTDPVQKLWQKFFRQHRKFKYEPYIISQGETDISKTIRSVVEYVVDHRCANSVFPFSLLPFKIFMYITKWKRSKISTGSSILVKRFASLYNTHMLFGQIDNDANEILSLASEEETSFQAYFGNLRTVDGGGPQRSEDRSTATVPQSQLQKPKNYADFVTMTEEEYNKLIEDLGEEKTLDMIEALNLWKGAKGRKTNSDYMTILNWVRREKKAKVRYI